MTRAEKAERRDIIVKLYSEGVSVDELTEQFQLGKYYIRNIVGARQESSIDILRKHSNEVKTLLDTQMSYADIGEMFGVNKRVVGAFCKENGMSRGSNANSEEDVARKIRGASSGLLEYVSGYTIKEKPVKVRCLVCGGEFEKTFHHLTTRSGVTCPHCVKAESEKNKQVKALNKIIRDQKKKAERLSRSQLISMRTCAECGELFIPKSKNNIRCSSACTRRAFNRSADARLNENNVVDKDITLTKLYKRDKGVCYLCGRKCNWNDYVTRSNGVVIAGDEYPSIEHVVPLSKGGLHCWDNVMLACRGCNTKKNAKILEA